MILVTEMQILCYQTLPILGILGEDVIISLSPQQALQITTAL